MSQTTTSRAEPEEVLASLLACHPEARVSAVTLDGTPVPVPDELALGPGHLLSGTAGMKAYAPQDRPLLMAAFDDALQTGHGVARARLLQDLDHALTINILDTSKRYGVLLVLAVPGTEGATLAAAPLAQPVVFPSHLARVYKSRSAKILDIDPATSEILGWTKAEMVGKRSIEFIHDDDQALAIENWAVLMTDPGASRRIRVRHRASDGQWIWFDVAHSETVCEGEACFVADMVDLTAEMQAQSALEAREQLLAELTQALPLGVFQIDHAERIVYTNHRLFDVMATTLTDTFDELVCRVTPEDRGELTAAMLRVMREGGGCEVEVRLDVPTEARQRVCQFTLHQLRSPTTPTHGVVGCVADVTERTLLRNELEDRATFDPLTRCYNRAAIMSRLEATLVADQENGTRTAVLFIDLDLFKAVNDRYGHLVGDEFLAATAARIQGCLRDDASLGRLGGDEFLVVLPRVTGTEPATVAERVSSALNRDISLSIGVIDARASVGVATAPSSTAKESAESLVTRADAAMYRIKHQRRGRQHSA